MGTLIYIILSVFLGHYAVALAAKRSVPEAHLGTLAAASVGPDLLWPILLLAGAESVRIAPGITLVTPLDFAHYPYSHSLLATAGWSLAAAAIYYGFRRAGKAAIAIGLCLFSHWLLDAIAHRPDLPLSFAPGSLKVGLGLWNSLPATLAVEAGLFGGALWLSYRGGIPGRPLLLFAGILTLIFAAAVLGPPPPSAAAVAVSALAQWLLVFWIGRLDRRPV